MILYPITIPGGSDTQVQYNNGGIFGGDSTFTFNDTTKILTAQTYNATDEDNVLQVDGTTIFKTGDIAKENIMIGEDTGGGLGNNNISIGHSAGKVIEAGGDGNILLGEDAGIKLTTGDSNVIMGASAGANLVTGSGNFLLGVLAGWQCTNSNNVAIGSRALQNPTTPIENVAIGFSALEGAFGAATAPIRNVAIGSQAGEGVISADRNVLLGYHSGQILTNGSDSAFIGYQSGINQTTNSNLLIIDNQDRGSAAAEITDCFIYGVMSATPASQTLRLNIGTTTWHNATHEDSDGGRASQFNFKGQQSGGEETTLARIEISHDGAADDEKGKVVISTNAGSDTDTPTDQLMIQSTGDLVVNKTSGVGLKVDLAAPTFGFADLLGDQFSKNTGGTRPALVEYNDPVDAWQFSDGEEAFLTFHIPHDYVAGTDIHLHIHWSQTYDSVTGGDLDFKYSAIYAKGHNQQSFGAPITGLFSSIVLVDDGLDQYRQHLTEVTISAATATAALFDRDDLEPDGVIELTFEMVANNLTGVAVTDPFIHYVDIHYQTTGVIGTKSRTPNFYT